jgi:hypothetical protein
MKIHTVQSLITCRKLNWIKQMVFNPDDNLQVFGALYGHLPWSKPQLGLHGKPTPQANVLLKIMHRNLGERALCGLQS